MEYILLIWILGCATMGCISVIGDNNEVDAHGIEVVSDYRPTDASTGKQEDVNYRPDDEDDFDMNHYR